MDALICGLDRTLRTLAGVHSCRRPSPAVSPECELDAGARKHSAALMRVNHSGEVCAQALYQSQALFARSPQVRAALDASAREEGDHLAWTAERVSELDGRLSVLNPFWYAGAFALGAMAARAGDPVNLGFLKETELQVVEHLTNHLEQLPAGDQRSREILRQMREDEGSHAEKAADLGAVEFPAVIRLLMKASAKVMTTVAFRI